MRICLTLIALNLECQLNYIQKVSHFDVAQKHFKLSEIMAINNVTQALRLLLETRYL